MGEYRIISSASRSQGSPFYDRATGKPHFRRCESNALRGGDEVAIVDIAISIRDDGLAQDFSSGIVVCIRDRDAGPEAYKLLTYGGRVDGVYRAAAKYPDSYMVKLTLESDLQNVHVIEENTPVDVQDWLVSLGNKYLWGVKYTLRECHKDYRLG